MDQKRVQVFFIISYLQIQVQQLQCRKATHKVTTPAALQCVQVPRMLQCSEHCSSAIAADAHTRVRGFVQCKQCIRIRSQITTNSQDQLKFTAWNKFFISCFSFYWTLIFSSKSTYIPTKHILRFRILSQKLAVHYCFYSLQYLQHVHHII